MIPDLFWYVVMSIIVAGVLAEFGFKIRNAIIRRKYGNRMYGH